MNIFAGKKLETDKKTLRKSKKSKKLRGITDDEDEEEDDEEEDEDEVKEKEDEGDAFGSRFSCKENRFVEGSRTIKLHITITSWAACASSTTDLFY